ncbi:Uncharacterised protein [Candidatus Ornithobacterium hominis]|uniref:Uncharacterized protein n=1 Tax=Candidatus Ornithobacterium hominis TaxID=2497989 RepID=A0A383TYE9_9FLAO|nr:hypothetical protein [Candidatus Ornithobacterium hominis]MCT7904201.1 hypothetical protein [Candidatus Ornithobacterium hominis]SZD72258.1 Uncharacterised protein [Candidatus Ornithobacterium hominis]SZD72537.1 Uncharacterised protein [Candidatus Ornithobacterium hominis]
MKNLNKTILSFIAGFIITYLLFIFRAEATQELALTNALGGGIGLAVGYFLYEKYMKEDSSS